MADEDQRPIVIKKVKKGGGHHGGAWKIAYADFVTAMMAFFLLMWLLGSTAKGDLQGIADYFNTPLKVAMSGGSGSGAGAVYVTDNNTGVYGVILAPLGSLKMFSLNPESQQWN